MTYAGLLIEQAFRLLLWKPYGKDVSDWDYESTMFLDLVAQFGIAWQRLPGMVPFVLVAVLAWFAIAYFINVKLISVTTGARSVSRLEEPELYNLLENLCISRGRRMPKLQIIETPVMNAYAAGVNDKQYTIAVTRGLLSALDRDELEAVLAHELAHLEHKDVRLMMVATVFVGIFSLFLEMLFNSFHYDVFRIVRRSGSSSNGGNSKGNAAGIALVMIIVALVIMLVVKLLAFVTQMAISRTREFMADAQAVMMTQNPEAMVSALQKISANSEMEGTPDDLRPMYIDNPLSSIGEWFSTHPSIRRRCQRITLMAGLARDGF